MAYYYVKNDGTATGDDGRYASQQTGSFASLGTSNYYSDIQDAIDNSTTSPVAGDFINVSDLHSFSNASNIDYVGKATIPFFIVGVDDANVDAARTSGNIGVEDYTGTVDFIINDSVISGVSIISNDNIDFKGQNTLIDCDLTVDTAGDRLISSREDGIGVTLIGCRLNINNSSSHAMFVQGGGYVRMVDCEVKTTAGSVTNFSVAGFANGGCELVVSGCDLSVVTGTLIADAGLSNTNDDLINIRFDMCKIASGVAFTNEVFQSSSQRALFTRCSNSSSAAEYQYHLHVFGGDVDDDSAIFRNEDPAFADSGQKISYKIVTM